MDVDHFLGDLYFLGDLDDEDHDLDDDDSSMANGNGGTTLSVSRMKRGGLFVFDATGLRVRQLLPTTLDPESVRLYKTKVTAQFIGFTTPGRDVPLGGVPWRRGDMRTCPYYASGPPLRTVV